MGDFETATTDSRPRRTLLRRLGYAGLFAIGVGAFAGGWATSAGDPVAPDDPDLVLIDPPVVEAATARPARMARVRPDARVIGVTVGGRHRAYVVAALSAVRRHVVNDLIGGVPLTVAYCDRTDCATAYTAADRANRLDLAVGGWAETDADAGMLVRAGQYRYRQTSGRSIDPDAPAFPFAGVVVEKTTWAEWRAAHPDTDVSEGGEVISQ